MSTCTIKKNYLSIGSMTLIRLTTHYYLYCIDSRLFLFAGAASVPLAGLKGGSITLPCCKNSGDDLSIVLTFGSETAYGRGQNEHFRGRVHESGSCDLILQDLKTTDAGKYTADVHDNSGLNSSNSFDVHVKGKVKTDLNIEFDLLLLSFSISVYFILRYTSVMPSIINIIKAPCHNCFIVLFLFS